ncbi:hypothetical protein TrVE_jg8283 [Triparma verrucosa]|uniref:Nitric oxide synthase-interacting protein zinc-finger domain-containing protein n=1 Tax=Triparma verrucosa TaxID=1606542 RepID=A0A9W7DMH9_9STRA|nr:hypothetical protein TrVE_jg8283 [Triparma verrucosa]
MVRRKSQKQNNHNPFTHQEARSTLTHYGTQSVRVGSDSQLPFGHCALSLTPIMDAVVSPSGTLYEREAAVSYLMREMEKLRVWREAYEQQYENDAKEQAQLEQKSLSEKVQNFEAKEGGVVMSGTETSHVNKHGEARKEKLKKEGFEVLDKEEKQNVLKRTSYWLSDWTPDAGKKRVEVPPKRASSPFSGRELRLKDLKSVTLKRDSDSTEKNAVGTDVVFVCAVSNKRLTTQPCVAITKTGSVMLKSSFDEFAKKDMVCPVTGSKFKDKDVVELKKCATGYASSGKVEAEVYRPTMV